MSSSFHLIVFTGAGISAESGLSTFRGQGGLWEDQPIEEVATPCAWQRDPERVHSFYNRRREQLQHVLPNAAHRYLADLQKQLSLEIITQNVDDLHDRAGSRRVLHLHGELTKVRCSRHEDEVFDWGHQALSRADKAPCGHPLRPHIVWFGEAVPAYERALEKVQKADALLIIGSALQVYPAAGLVDEIGPECPRAYLDPGDAFVGQRTAIHRIRKKATEGLNDVQDWLETIGAL